MASGSEYSLPYASLIIQEYEKASIEAAVDTRSRDLCAIPWLKSLAAYNMLLDSAEKVLSEDIPGMQKKAKKAQGKNPGWASRAQAASPQAEKSDSSSAPEDSSPCSFSPIWEQDKAFKGIPPMLAEGARFELKDMEDKAYSAVDEAAASWLGLSDTPWDGSESYLEDCWSCMLDLDFDWQIAPINWAFEINKLLRQIDDSIEWMLDKFDSNLFFLKKFCLDGWNLLWKLVCPIDIVAIMSMLKGLIVKYKSDLISISLDWTAIVGPLLKSLGDIMASLVEQIDALISNPLSCLIDMMNAFDRVIDQGYNTWETITNSEPLVFWRDQFLGLNTPPVSTDIEPIKGKALDPGKDFARLGPPWGESVSEMQEDLKSRPEVTRGVKASLTFDELIETVPMEQLNATKALSSSLQEVKDDINELSEKIIFSYKSLGTILNGQLNLSIKKGGLTMLLLDLISFCYFAYEYLQDIDCDEESGDDRIKVSQALSALSAAYPAYDVLIAGDDSKIDEETFLNPSNTTIQLRRKADGALQNISFASCSLDPKVASKGMDKTFETLQKNVKLRKAAWGI